MSNEIHQGRESGPGHRSVEVGFGLFTLLFGLIVVIGSWKAGINWGSDGPRAGFFPFYVGLIIIGSSVLNLLAAIRAEDGRERLFSTWGELRQVLSVIIPTAIYVVAVPTVGIYISSMLLIGFFMRWLGKYPWRTVLPLAIGVPVAVYIVFERWFLISLPKGPIEYALGL